MQPVHALLASAKQHTPSSADDRKQEKPLSMLQVSITSCIVNSGGGTADFLKASYKVVGNFLFKSHNIIRLLILHSERPRVFLDKCAGPY
jgi:hypothetical protein